MYKNLSVLASLRENSKCWFGRTLVVGYVLIAIAAVLPYGSKAETVHVASIGLDKIIHFVGFGCMAFLALGAGSGRGTARKILFLLTLVLFGVGTEWVQYYVPYRTFNPVDILANGIGIGTGILVWWISNISRRGTTW